MKIRITSPEHSKKVQKKLFEEGYRWLAEDYPTVMHTDWPVLFTGSRGVITGLSTEGWGMKNFYVSHKNPEYVLTHQGEFMLAEEYFKQPKTPVKNDPVSITPRALHERQRQLGLLKAILNNMEGGYEVPHEWVEELGMLFLIKKYREEQN